MSFALEISAEQWYSWRMEFRRATAADDRVIKDMIHREHLNPMQLDWRHFWLAVDSDGRVVGCAQVKTFKDGSRELASLVVDEKLRGQGLARRLIERLQAENSPTLYLTCRSSLQPLYQRFGFAAVSVDKMPPYYRFISRLAGWMMRLARRNETLAVMRWDGPVS